MQFYRVVLLSAVFSVTMPMIVRDTNASPSPEDKPFVDTQVRISISKLVNQEETPSHISTFGRVSAPAPAESLLEQVHTLLRTAKEHYTQKNYAAAIADYTDALELQENGQHVRVGRERAGTLNNRGVAYEQQGNHAAAIADFNAGLELQENGQHVWVGRERVTTLNNRGVAYEQQGNHAAAIADYTDDLELQENGQHVRVGRERATTLNNRGVAYEQQGNYAAAIADFNAALDLKVEDQYALLGNDRESVHRSLNNAHQLRIQQLQREAADLKRQLESRKSSERPAKKSKKK